MVLREVVPREQYKALVGPPVEAPADCRGFHYRQGLTAEQALEQLFPVVEAGVLNGEAVVSVATTSHADRMDVVHLQERLEQRCKDEFARLHGICAIREGIYDDTLNELIRQVTVLCPERGLLLAELRDEVAETNSTYDLLFDSACQYAVRKGIERDLKRTMQAQVGEYHTQMRTLENRVHELRAKYEGTDKRLREQRATEEKLHQEEVQFLKKGNLQLTNEIKRLSA